MASGQHRGRPPGRRLSFGWRHPSGWRWLPLGLGGAVLAGAAVIVIALTQVASPQACAAPVPALAASTGVTGIATHYVLSAAGGNCSYPAAPSDGLFVALSPGEYDGAAACGSYLEVTGPDGSVQAEVIDQCPPCQAGHIDLSETAFAKLAPLSAGLIDVTYRVIADPALPGPVSLQVKTGSSPYWLALLPMNTGNPVASVAVQGASGGWQELVRADYNYWIGSSGAGAGPFDVRITDTFGHQVLLTGIALDPGVVQTTGLDMYGAGTTAPAASQTATPARLPTRPAATATSKKPVSRSAAAAVTSTSAPATAAPAAVASTPAPAPSPTASC